MPGRWPRNCRERDPAHKSDYEQRLRVFLASMQPLEAKIAELRRKYAGIDVTATEPVFGYMSAALGFRMRNERFQLAVMNDAEPRASDVAAFETDLRKHAVRLLFYNSQATDAAAQRLVRDCPAIEDSGRRRDRDRAARTRPTRTGCMSELDAIAQALSDGPS